MHKWGSNRTFMELKWWCRSSLRALSVVLIVPLWNWNSSSRYGRGSGCSVLIVPLWNWNPSRRRYTTIARSSNRTFMELKLTSSPTKYFDEYVLIVPLWNWNTLYNVDYLNGSNSSNRTFMELKFGNILMEFAKSPAGSNRTFMELKCQIGRAGKAHHNGF